MITFVLKRYKFLRLIIFLSSLFQLSQVNANINCNDAPMGSARTACTDFVDLYSNTYSTDFLNDFTRVTVVSNKQQLLAAAAIDRTLVILTASITDLTAQVSVSPYFAITGVTGNEELSLGETPAGTTSSRVDAILRSTSPNRFIVNKVAFDSRASQNDPNAANPATDLTPLRAIRIDNNASQVVVRNSQFRHTNTQHRPQGFVYVTSPGSDSIVDIIGNTVDSTTVYSPTADTELFHVKCHTRYGCQTTHVNISDNIFGGTQSGTRKRRQTNVDLHEAIFLENVSNFRIENNSQTNEAALADILVRYSAFLDNILTLDGTIANNIGHPSPLSDVDPVLRITSSDISDPPSIRGTVRVYGNTEYDFSSTSVNSLFPPLTVSTTIPVVTTQPPATTQGPPNTPVEYSSCDLLFAATGDTDERTVCNSHFSTGLTIFKIAHDSEMYEETLSTPNALFIFDALSSEGHFQTYNLPGGYSAPQNSTTIFAGNGSDDIRPTLRITSGDSSSSVMSFLGSTSQSSIINMEVDSTTASSLMNVINLRDGAQLTLKNSKIVRNFSTGTRVNPLEAISIRCSNNTTTRLILESTEIDISSRHDTVSTPASGINITSGCSATSRAEITMNNSQFKIDDIDSENTMPSGRAFFFHSPNNGVSFTSGSTCNSILDTNGNDISSDHIGSAFFPGTTTSASNALNGALGLLNGRAWGLRADSSNPGSYLMAFADWLYWPELTVSCPGVTPLPTTQPPVTTQVPTTQPPTTLPPTQPATTAAAPTTPEVTTVTPTTPEVTTVTPTTPEVTTVTPTTLEVTTKQPTDAATTNRIGTTANTPLVTTQPRACGEPRCATPPVQADITGPCKLLCTLEEQDRCQAFISQANGDDSDPTGGATFTQVESISTSAQLLECQARIVDGGQILMINEDLTLPLQNSGADLQPQGVVAFVGRLPSDTNGSPVIATSSTASNTIVRLCQSVDEDEDEDGNGCQVGDRSVGFYAWGIDWQITGSTEGVLQSAVSKDDSYNGPVRITNSEFSHSNRGLNKTAHYVSLSNIKQDVYLADNTFDMDLVASAGAAITASCSGTAAPSLPNTRTAGKCVQQQRLSVLNNQWRSDSLAPINDNATAIQLTNIPKATIERNAEASADAGAGMSIVFTHQPINAGVADYTVDLSIRENTVNNASQCSARTLLLQSAGTNMNPIPLEGLVNVLENSCYLIDSRSGFNDTRQCAHTTIDSKLCDNALYQCAGSLDTEFPTTIGGTTTPVTEPTVNEGYAGFICSGTKGMSIAEKAGIAAGVTVAVVAKGVTGFGYGCTSRGTQLKAVWAVSGFLTGPYAPWEIVHYLIRGRHPASKSGSYDMQNMLFKQQDSTEDVNAPIEAPINVPSVKNRDSSTF